MQLKLAERANLEDTSENVVIVDIRKSVTTVVEIDIVQNVKL
jgi:hypothetical protein